MARTHNSGVPIMLRPKKKSQGLLEPGEHEYIAKVAVQNYSSPYAQKNMIFPKRTGRRKQRATWAHVALKPVASNVQELMVRVHNSPSLEVLESRLKGIINRNLPRPAGGMGLNIILDDGDDASVDSSHRSLGSLGSFGSLRGGSLMSRTSHASMISRSEMSLRAMVEDIETRAKNNLDAPDYVPAICDLPLSQISWKALLGRRAVSSSKIDIIPCHQSLQLILAKAYERSSKLQNVLAVKKAHVDDQQRKLISNIQHKLNRAEEYAAALKCRQMQVAWMKLIVLVRFTDNLRIVYQRECVAFAKRKVDMKASLTLYYFFNSIVKKRIEQKFKEGFMKKAGQFIWRLLIGIKIFRKKMASKKILDFLRSFKGNQRIKIVIHRFVASAHLLQRTARDFNAINRERLHIMCKIWDALELQYVIRRLEDRRKLELNALKGQKNSAALVDAKTLILMNKQADQWRAIDARMEQGLQKHRVEGLLPNAESIKELAKTKLIAWEHKNRALQKYIAMRRKAFVLLRDEVITRRQKQLETFSCDDAHDLLRGRPGYINKMLSHDSAHGTSGNEKIVNANPFLLFKGVDKKALLALIAKVHEIVGTFTIKIRKKGADGTKDLMNIHPQILAARKLKEEIEKRENMRRIADAIDAAGNAAVLLVQSSFVINEGQKKRRGGVQLQTYDVL